MGAKAKGQLGLDEEVVDNPELEEKLEERAKRAHSLAALRVQFEAADEAAKAALDELGLVAGDVIRVGRFRITKDDVPAREVTFESKATVRVRIAEEE